MTNYLKMIWTFLVTYKTQIFYVLKLTWSVVKTMGRKKAPHNWVSTSTLERKRTRVYARCSRCGATR